MGICTWGAWSRSPPFAHGIMLGCLLEQLRFREIQEVTPQVAEEVSVRRGSWPLLLALEGATRTSFLPNVCPALGAWDTGQDVTRASGLQTLWAALNLGLQSPQGSRPAMEEWAGWWV